MGAADAGREGSPDGVPSRRGLSLLDVGPGEPERDTGCVDAPVAVPERCFDLCFFLRIEVSVPLPASERIGEPGLLRLADLDAASLSVSGLSDLRLVADGVVAPDGSLTATMPSGCRVPGAASIWPGV